jgi:hypothetical protein
MSTPATTPAQLHAAILQYITQLQAGGASDESGIKDAEPLEIASQCLIEATGADAKDAPKVSRRTENEAKRCNHLRAEACMRSQQRRFVAPRSSHSAWSGHGRSRSVPPERSGCMLFQQPA